ncbi:family 16 glycosylhydrolase [Mucisphaera sp.]|uniref:family 16 glycosylhydrolase n=1 Tax=Mucisphaera sp. TaxID=2913024 RepID=UPI003D099D4E
MSSGRTQALAPTLASCLLFLGATSLHADPLDRPGFNFAWEETFSGTAINTDLWNVLNRRDSFNNEKQYYLPEQVAVADGNLVITATDEPFAGKAYRSGLVRTKFEQTYGRWEVRAKLPTSQGMWPAIWLLPDEIAHPWPTGGEIDIMENRGSNPFTTSSAYHWGPSWPSNFLYGEYQEINAQGQAVNFHETFNTYAVEWEPEEIRFYVNDNHHFTVHESAAPISDAPMSLIINLAIGGDFGGDPDASSSFPQQMEVDYVRVWELDQTPQPPSLRGPNQIANAAFEDNLNGWNRFGGGANVALSTQQAFTGDDALKLSGNFSNALNYSGVAQGFTVTPGERIELSASAFVEELDALGGTDSFATMKLEFYSTFGGGFGSPAMISVLETTIADDQTIPNDWLLHTLEAVVPPNAVEARIAFVFGQANFAPGSVYIDNVALRTLIDALPGDANTDGNVNLIDLSILAAHFNQPGPWTDGDFNADKTINLIDLSLLAANFGQSALPIPEPAATSLILVLFAGKRRRMRPRPEQHQAEHARCHAH